MSNKDDDRVIVVDLANPAASGLPPEILKALEALGILPKHRTDREMYNKVNAEFDMMVKMIQNDPILQPPNPIEDLRGFAHALYHEQLDDTAVQARNCAYLAVAWQRIAAGSLTKLDVPETAAGQDNSADITSEGIDTK